MLRNVRTVDCSTTLFGRKVRLPVFIAPVGGLQLFWDGGVATVAEAAGEFGVPMMQSSATEPPLEEVAKRAPKADKIFQLYVRGDDKFVDDYYKRSQDAGFAPQFCFTVDLAHYTPARARPGETLFALVRPQPGRARHPGLARLGADRALPQAPSGGDQSSSRASRPARTRRSRLDSGVGCIYVTNHGGRALDHARGAMDILPEVVDVVKGRVPILIDGAFYRGTDVVKAIAMGASAVGLGRLYCYALAAAGRPGIVRMLELLGRRDPPRPRPDGARQLRQDRQVLCLRDAAGRRRRTYSARIISAMCGTSRIELSGRGGLS